MSEFKEWRLASGYAYDVRQEQAWSAATRVERERCVQRCEELARKYRNKERKYIANRCATYIQKEDILE